jgi:hypothetical protein
VVGKNFLAGYEQVNGIAESCLGAIEEPPHLRRTVRKEASGNECCPGGLQSVRTDKQIDIWSIPHASFIDLGNPNRNRMSTDNRVGHSGRFQGDRRS